MLVNGGLKVHVLKGDIKFYIKTYFDLDEELGLTPFESLNMVT